MILCWHGVNGCFNVSLHCKALLEYERVKVGEGTDGEKVFEDDN